MVGKFSGIKFRFLERQSSLLRHILSTKAVHKIKRTDEIAAITKSEYK